MKKIFFVLLWFLFFGCVMPFSSAQSRSVILLDRSLGVMRAQKIDVRKAVWEQQEQERIQTERGEATYASNQNYCDFLNSVARTDLHGLYNFQLEENGIVRSGSPGTYHYEIINDQGNAPVTSISWASAARYVNWLEHHQVIPESDKREDVDAVTEEGAYDLAGDSCINVHQESGHLLPKNATEVSFGNFPDIGTWGSPDLEDWSNIFVLRKSDPGITMENVDAQLGLKNVGIRFITTRYYLGEANPTRTWLGDAELVGEVTFGAIASFLVGRYVHQRWCGNEGRPGMSPEGGGTTDPYELERQERQEGDDKAARYQHQKETPEERRQTLEGSIRSLKNTMQQKQEQLNELQQKIEQDRKKKGGDGMFSESQRQEELEKIRNLRAALKTNERNLEYYEEELAKLGPAQQATSSGEGAPVGHDGEFQDHEHSISSSSSSAAAAETDDSSRMQISRPTPSLSFNNSPYVEARRMIFGMKSGGGDTSTLRLISAAGVRNEELQRQCREALDVMAMHQRNRGRKIETAITRSNEDLIEVAKMDMIEQSIGRESGAVFASAPTRGRAAGGKAGWIRDRVKNFHHNLIDQKATLLFFRKILEQPNHDQSALADQIKDLNTKFEELRTGFRKAIDDRRDFYQQEKLRLVFLQGRIEAKKAELEKPRKSKDRFRHFRPKENLDELNKLNKNLLQLSSRLENLNKYLAKDATDSNTRSEVGSESRTTEITRPRKTPLEHATDDLLSSFLQDECNPFLEVKESTVRFSAEALVDHVSDSDLVRDVMSSARKNFSQADRYLALVEVIYERVDDCSRLIEDGLRSVPAIALCHPSFLFSKIERAYEEMAQALSHLERAEQGALNLIRTKREEVRISSRDSLKAVSALIDAHFAARTLELREAKAICDDYLGQIETAAYWKNRKQFGSAEERETARQAFHKSLYQQQPQQGFGSAEKKKRESR